MSKGGERASSVALPQPAANGAFAGAGRSRVAGVMVGLGGVVSAGLGRRAGRANGAKRRAQRLCRFFAAEQHYRRCGMKA